MDYGFMRLAAATPRVTVGNCRKNADEIISLIQEAERRHVSLLVFPELCITGYTCADLFFQTTLLEAAQRELCRIAAATERTHVTAAVGLPFPSGKALYNTAAVVSGGAVRGLVPKTFIPNYGEFYERRQFAPAFPGIRRVSVSGTSEQYSDIPFGTDILFTDGEHRDICFAVEICEDLWSPQPPSIRHAAAGAVIIANLSASNEIIGKAAYRRMLVTSQSAHLAAAYVYADCGAGESTTDMVFAGHNLIAENGTVLRESQLFSAGMITADTDTERLLKDRRRITTFGQAFPGQCADSYVRLSLSFGKHGGAPDRYIDPHPFIPSDRESLSLRCREVSALQTAGLVKRLEHTQARCAVIGLSGGLDSTLALLVTAEAFGKLSYDMKNIIAVTMPCFGTTDRTYENAVKLAHALGVTLREIPVTEAVLLHFRDIGHDPAVRDVTYENSQARERTQVLMDIANSCGGLVIGTGDLSELALGWATYNGDHMSMYGVNASVPKTLVRHLVRSRAEDGGPDENAALKAVLADVLDTPVSPELLPPEDGSISQKTEDIVGPYELHDFFLYYMVRWGFSPEKILFLAETAFSGTQAEALSPGKNAPGTSCERTGTYSRGEIRRWLAVFYRRFFSQQFKRSCLPDGPKIGSVSLSPRGDWRMPSDADAAEWLASLQAEEKER